MSEEELICGICDENKAVYKSICADCFISGFTTLEKVNGHTCFEILRNIRKIKANNLCDLPNYKKCVELYKFLLIQMKQKFSFVPSIEIKCKCGEIKKRIIPQPYAIHCWGCGSYCCDCGELTHTNYSYNCEPLYYHNNLTNDEKKDIVCNKFTDDGVQIHYTCKEYKQIIDTYSSKFITMWKSSLSNTTDEHIRIMKLREQEELSLISIKSESLKQCPFCRYGTAKIYEEYLVRENKLNKKEMLTKKYTEKTWPKVACNGEPVFREQCKEMVCGEHNPERIKEFKEQGITVGKYKGCGRIINWDHWVSVNPKVNKTNYSSIEKPTIVKLTTTEGIVKEYKCVKCKENRTCIALVRHTRPYRYKRLCGHCIVENSFKKERQKKIRFSFENKTFYMNATITGTFEGTTDDNRQLVVMYNSYHDKLALVDKSSGVVYGTFKWRYTCDFECGYCDKCRKSDHEYVFEYNYDFYPKDSANYGISRVRNFYDDLSNDILFDKYPFHIEGLEKFQKLVEENIPKTT